MHRANDTLKSGFLKFKKVIIIKFKSEAVTLTWQRRHHPQDQSRSRGIHRGGREPGNFQSHPPDARRRGPTRPEPTAWSSIPGPYSPWPSSPAPGISGMKSHWRTGPATHERNFHIGAVGNPRLNIHCTITARSENVSWRRENYAIR